MATMRGWMAAGMVAVALGVGAGRGLAAEAEPEFKPIFNGTDLTGWREVQGKPGSFRVENGELLGERKGGTGYWLSTEEKYGNFILKLEYMLPKGGNSGVFLRVPSYEGRTSQAGMEIQLLDDGHKKGTPSAGDTGAVYQVTAAKAYVARPAGEWNDLTIECRGDLIRVTINGQLINETNMAEHPKLAQRPRAGYLGLSAHTHLVRFRNVQLAVLPD